MIGYVAKLLSGRLKHWVHVHDPAANEYRGRIEKLPVPYCNLLIPFLVNASVLLEKGLLEDGWKRLGVQCNIKVITAEQFHTLYDTIMTAFVFAFAESRHDAIERSKIWHSFTTAAHNRQTLQPFVDQLKALDAINPAALDPAKTFRERTEAHNQKPAIDLFKIGAATWDRIGEILGFSGDTSVGGMTSFSLLFSQLYVDFQQFVLQQ